MINYFYLSISIAVLAAFVVSLVRSHAALFIPSGRAAV